MDAIEHGSRSIGYDQATVVVEITAPVPREEVDAIAKRLAERLGLPARRVRRLLDGRLGPVSKPVRPEKAEILRRVFEQEGVSVVERPAGSDESIAHGSSPRPRPADRSEPVGAGSACLSRADDDELPDAVVSAMLYGMVAIAMAEGRSTEAELHAVRLALESMTGTDVGLERVAALASSKGAGDLLRAHAMVAALAPTLTEGQRCAGIATFRTVADAGTPSPGKAEAASVLSAALAALTDAG